MKIRLPALHLPFAFSTRFGRVQIVIVCGDLSAPGIKLPTAAAFARPMDPGSPHLPVQVSRTKRLYREVLENLLTGFELPCDLEDGDDFLAAVIDGLVEDPRVAQPLILQES